jgi:hypothetical protein
MTDTNGFFHFSKQLNHYLITYGLAQWHNFPPDQHWSSALWITRASYHPRKVDAVGLVTSNSLMQEVYVLRDIALTPETNNPPNM